MGIIKYKGITYGGGIDAIADASDVNLSSPADGQFLKYDATNEEWVNVSLGTAANKNYTTSVTSGSTDLVTSGAVKSAIDASVSSAYHASGSKDVDELLPSLLVAGNLGNVYDMNDGGETTEYFVEGAGLPIRAGDNVGIVNVGTDADPVYKFDLLSGFVDLSDYYDSDEVDELLADKADTDSLGDLASIDIDGSSSTKFLRGDGTWQNQAAQAQSDWAQTDNTQADFIKNKPTIPTVGDGTITIQKNGTAVDTFTTNQSSAKTINITMAKADVGLGNVPNVTTDNQTPTVTEATTRANLATGDTLKTIIGKIKKYFTDLKDLAFIAKDGTSSTKYLRGDGTWQAFPTIPTVNNGTLTIKQNGTSKGTFTANQSTAATVELTDTTYSDATTSASGLMSSTDKTKLNGIASGAEVNVQSDWNVTDSGSDAYIKNKPSIPAAQVNSDWNASSGVAQILNKPTIPSVATKYDSSDAAETTLADDDKIPFYDTSASGRRNSTWANIKAKLKSYFDGIYSTFSGAYSDLTGKPTLGTAAAKDVPSSGNASSAQVVMGNDTRLTDARNAADVYSWAKASTKPSYTASEVGAIPLNGSENITGDLMPKNDDSITLGATNKRYSSVWSKNLYATEALRVGTQENKGHVDFWDSSGYSALMLPTALTGNRALYLPNKSGTLAITDDIPTVQDNASATDLTDTSVPTGRTIESYLNSNAFPLVMYKNPWYVIPVGYIASSSAPYCYLINAQVTVNNMAITLSHGSMYYRDTTINLPFTCSDVVPLVSAKPSAYKVIGTVSSWTGTQITVTAMCPMSTTVNVIFMLSVFVRTASKIS